MHEQPTVIGSWAVAIARALEASGYDSQALFAEAGIDLDASALPDARLSLGDINRIWALALEATQNPCFGFEVAGFVLPTTFHALGYACWASESLRAVFHRVVRYHRLVTDAAELALEERDTDSRLVARVLYPGMAYQAQDSGLACIVTICRVLYKPDFKPISVALTRPEPKHSEHFEAFFRAPVRFAAREIAIAFSNHDLDAPLPGNNPELAQYNDRVATEYLARLEMDRVSSQVRAKLIEQLPSGEPTEEGIAQRLNMSLRSLQRKLHDERTSYREILDRTREDMACEYLNRNRLSLSEIAFMLGFSDSSNFSRAFKRWTGEAPSHYRETHGRVIQG